jgi:hypothetical protein
MKTIIVLLLLILMSAQTFAADCPVQFGDDNYLDKVGAAIQATKTCEEGAAMAESCALGASGDAYIAPIAERKCGLDFWTKLSSADRQTYNGLQTKCANKYKNMQGTMYISFNAFCHLQVARLYSELYTRAD